MRSPCLTCGIRLLASSLVAFTHSEFPRFRFPSVWALNGLERQEMKSKGIDSRRQLWLVVGSLEFSACGHSERLALDRWEELTQAGLKLQQQGRMTEAEEKLREALSEAEEFGSQDASKLAKSFHNLGTLLYDQSRYPDAESFYKTSIATMEKQPGLDQRDLAGMLNNLALLHTKQGRLNEAEPLYLRSLAMVEKTLGPEHFDVATSLNNLAALYCQTR